jgi:hypothetical protein
VFIKGFFYDVNGAAVELLEARLAQLVGNYDVSGQGITLRRSQVFDHIDILIAACYERMEPGVAIQTRSDIQMPNEALDTVFGTNGISNGW